MSTEQAGLTLIETRWLNRFIRKHVLFVLDVAAEAAEERSHPHPEPTP